MKRVMNMNTGEIFESLRAAAESVGTTPPAISYAISRGQRCGGTYWEFVDKETKSIPKVWRVYKLTSPVGLVYIGITGQLIPRDRWDYGNGYKFNKRLYGDIMNVGWSNFQHEVLATCETKEEALDLEHKYIVEYKAYLPEKGYNKQKNDSRFHIPHRGKRVIREDTGEIFENISAAAESIGVSKSGLSLALKQKRPCKKISFRLLDEET